MMVTREQVKIGLSGGIPIALILSALAMGVISPTEIKDTYYCQSRDLAVDCTKLSSTTKTCYRDGLPNMVCTDGWKPIADFIPDQEPNRDLTPIDNMENNLPCSDYAYKKVCRLA